MSAFTVYTVHFVCYLRFFCYCVDGKDHFKNDLKKKKSRTDLGAKLV